MQTQTFPASMHTSRPRPRQRTALVASADASFRQRLSRTLAGLRWKVQEAGSGAAAWAEAEAGQPEAMIVDSWLPDLDFKEFLRDFCVTFPDVDLISAGGEQAIASRRGPYRQELLHALRSAQDGDTAAWNSAPARSLGEAQNSDQNSAGAAPVFVAEPLPPAIGGLPPAPALPVISLPPVPSPNSSPNRAIEAGAMPAVVTLPAVARELAMPAAALASERLPELVGDAQCMLEVSRRVRLVAPRTTPVLIEGPTGSGKELVAEAVHRLSARSRKPFVAINCAAIPEALLEAELFGHTRGAFTGAVQGRVGRIEAADGGTLFLDEIGEMPLALQSKLLRFVECGELQRVGDNETVKVNVRIVAATHRKLAEQAAAGGFRSDLYYRLAVFLIRTPALAAHLEDVPLLVEHFLARLGREAPVKRVDPGALAKLAAHDWPGNVRELEHVLERAAILAGDAPVLTASEIDFGLAVN